MRQLGVRGLFTGFGPRTVMVTSIIAGQFLIYDSVKLAFGV
jgi:solute carrier family 25 phosphate transporter 3